MKYKFDEFTEQFKRIIEKRIKIAVEETPNYKPNHLFFWGSQAKLPKKIKYPDWYDKPDFDYDKNDNEEEFSDLCCYDDKYKILGFVRQRYGSIDKAEFHKGKQKTTNILDFYKSEKLFREHMRLLRTKYVSAIREAMIDGMAAGGL